MRLLCDCCVSALQVAPDTTHSDTGSLCNYDTYSQRGWCRLEQWARLASQGTIDLFKWMAKLPSTLNVAHVANTCQQCAEPPFCCLLPSAQ